MKKPIKGILFDKDGTLLDFHLSWGPINKQAALFAASGDPVLASQLLVAGGLDLATDRYKAGAPLASGTTREIAQNWIDAGSPFELEALTNGVDGIFRAGVANVVPVLDLAAFFRRLKERGLNLGIASSDGEAAIHMTAERFAFAGLMDFIVGYDSGHGCKPEPGMLNAFAAHCSLVNDEIAVVGDNLHDLEMAHRGGAGLAIAVLTGTGTRADLAGSSDLCLDSIADLEAALFG